MEFIVYGEPTGKGRPRFTAGGHTYTPEKTVSYENLVKSEFLRQCGGEPLPRFVPVRMDIEAYFTIPRSAGKAKRKRMLDREICPTKKPDADNIIKIIADSLNGIAYYDDSQIVHCSCRKLYGEAPCVRVEIREAGDEKLSAAEE